MRASGRVLGGMQQEWAWSLCDGCACEHHHLLAHGLGAGQACCHRQPAAHLVLLVLVLVRRLTLRTSMRCHVAL
jgi:hypothetical protein